MAQCTTVPRLRGNATDGGGSIRIPAAFCGVVGFKPTFGRVPRDPCFPPWRSLVAYGPLARSVADVRLMLSSILKPTRAQSPAPSMSDPKRTLQRLEGSGQHSNALLLEDQLSGLGSSGDKLRARPAAAA